MLVLHYSALQFHVSVPRIRVPHSAFDIFNWVVWEEPRASANHDLGDLQEYEELLGLVCVLCEGSWQLVGSFISSLIIVCF